MGCVWNYFFFRFPITSYNIFHSSSPLSFCSHTLLLFHLHTRRHTHRHTLNYSLSQTHIALLSHPLCSINLPAVSRDRQPIVKLMVWRPFSVNQSVVVSFLLAIHELSWLRFVYLDRRRGCIQQMQWLIECGLTRVSRLIQACGVTGGERGR